MTVCMLDGQQFTRGIGVYPGDPKEDFAPEMTIDRTYRNLARLRPAYHSSSYDYNLTAQLVTDGIKDTALPRWVSTATSETGILKRHERELILDDNAVSTVNLRGPQAWVQLELGGGTGAPEVDRVDVFARGQSSQNQPAGWTCIVSGSDDGQAWKELGRAAGTDRPGREFKPSVTLNGPSRSRFYRVELNAPSVTAWRVAEVSLFKQGSRVRAGGPYAFTSAWMSAGAGEEWVSVDLGAPCTFDRVALYWIRRAAEASIQVSDDAKTWTTVQALPPSSGMNDDIKLSQPAKGRYVRVLMTRPASPEGYILSEMEVYGRGGPVPKPRATLSLRGNGRLDLGRARGACSAIRWSPPEATRFRRRASRTATGSSPPCPATVLTSYLNAGALPDPNFGDNQLMISDSFFHADFWYRTEFTAPRAPRGRHLWLNFDGINWKADVFLNGEKLGRIEGGFMRGRFDVTSRIRPGDERTRGAHREERDAGQHQGEDVPEPRPERRRCSAPTIRPITPRSAGTGSRQFAAATPASGTTSIWITSGPVTIENPFVTTTLPLPDTSRADVSHRGHAAEPWSRNP